MICYVAILFLLKTTTKKKAIHIFFSAGLLLFSFFWLFWRQIVSALFCDDLIHIYTHTQPTLFSYVKSRGTHRLFYLFVWLIDFFSPDNFLLVLIFFPCHLIWFFNFLVVVLVFAKDREKERERERERESSLIILIAFGCVNVSLGQEGEPARKWAGNPTGGPACRVARQQRQPRLAPERQLA